MRRRTERPRLHVEVADRSVQYLRRGGVDEIIPDRRDRDCAHRDVVECETADVVDPAGHSEWLRTAVLQPALDDIARLLGRVYRGVDGNRVDPLAAASFVKAV